MANTGLDSPNDSIRLSFWNASGLSERIFELEQFIHEHDIHIMLVNETHLGPRQKPRVQGYQFYHSVNNIDHHRRGGTAIFIKRGIDHSHLPLNGLNHLEATAIILNTDRGLLKVVSAYQSPSKLILSDDLDLIFNDNTPTIMAGDLNSKSPVWNSRLTNRNGRILLQYIDNSIHTIRAVGPENPTFFHSNPDFRPDVLDIALLCNLNSDHDIWSFEDMSSDHNPVLMDVAVTTRSPTWEFKTTNWQKY